MSTNKQERDKFQARDIPCVFLGYPFGKKTYKVMILDTNTFCTSRDIVFHENILPFSISTEKPLFPTSMDITLDCFEAPQNIQSAEPEPSQQTITLTHDTPDTRAETQQARKSARPHRTPGNLNDYVCIVHTESSYFTTLTNLGLQPLTMLVFCLNSNSQQILKGLDFTEPKTFEQASSHLDWQAAMQKEL